MTDSEKLTALTAMTGETTQSVLLTYLSIAGERIIAKAYPFRNDILDVPSCYDGLHIEIASYLLNKRGAEGETAHSENGINRTYESASIPDSMLKSVVPHCGVT